MSKKYYITAAIPYVNAPPHLGHALEFLQCDCIARYQRLVGKDTCLLTGADENSLKNVQAAEKENLSVQDLCNKNAKEFQNLIKVLDASFDIFQRSSGKDHFKGSQKLWQLCNKSGDIYKKEYKGLYCVGCEAFYTTDELTDKGLCPEHLKKPQKVAEDNYFFRLSKYQKKLEELISSDEVKIVPRTRKNEVLSFIKMGLEDFSISRSIKRAKNWGVPVPDDPTQIMYVWFDALNVYQTGVGFGSNEKKYNKWWPADMHVIGKGITRFHAIYWIAILLSAKLKLPKSIFIHGYITIEGQKMSKSLGNVVNPKDFVKKYGTDALRYYLLREIPSYSDGDFSQKRFKELYNADLANGLGNLVARIARLCEKVELKKVKEISFSKDVKKHLDQFRFDEALKYIWTNIRKLDKYIDENKPWTIKDKKKLTNVMHKAAVNLLQVAYALQPFLPQTANSIIKQFSKTIIKSEKPLFPRI